MDMTKALHDPPYAVLTLYMYLTAIWFLFISIMIIWITVVHLEFIYHKKENFMTVCDLVVVKPTIDL